MAKVSRAERGVTVKDVAAKCGYAVSTCIDILGGRGGRYSEQTQSVVSTTAAQMGYRRSAAARAMRTGRTNCVALIGSILPELSVIPHPLLHSLERSLSSRGKLLAVAGLSDETLTRKGELPRLLAEWFCDGLLVNYQKKVPREFAHFVDDLDLPAVWINNRRQHDCVHPDDRGGLYEATRRLLALGHRRIGYADPYVGWIGPEAHYSVGDRLAGYRDALGEAGLVENLVIGEGEAWHGQIDAMRVATRWMEAPDRPTAVISAELDLLQALVAAAWRLDLQVPRDLSLVYVGSGPGFALGLRLDLARIPIGEVGEQGVAMLFAKGSDATARQRPVAVPFEHETHGSSCPPR